MIISTFYIYGATIIFLDVLAFTFLFLFCKNLIIYLKKNLLYMVSLCFKFCLRKLSELFEPMMLKLLVSSSDDKMNSN